jgi:4-amino-4-deoxy-L-arabinose transferase-like glycosyltransferase
MPEFTTNQHKGVFAPVTGWMWLLVFAGVPFIYLFGLTIPLVGPDEPRYAQVAREMFESGNWITPTLGGFTWFEKPALLYWLQAAAFSVFGVGEFAARFGSALCGLGTVAALFRLGWAADLPDGGRKGAGASDRVSFTHRLAVIAASSLGLIVFSRAASFDIVVTFPLTASMVSFFIFDRNGSRLYLALFYFFIGVALLAKGLIGILFPFGIVAAYYLFSLQLPSRRFMLSLFWGVPLALLVAAAWYLPAYMQNGWPFVDEFIIQHHFQRFTSNKYQHPQPFFFFLWVLPLMIFPWSPFLFAELWRRTSQKLKGRDEQRDSRRIFRFALAWMLVPLVFFSFSGSKLPGYILPAVPPAIVIATLWLHRRASFNPAWSQGIIACFVATMLLIFVLLLTAVPRFADTDSVKRLVAAAAERGHRNERLLMFYTLSHNAEFYAAGRVFRDGTGKQRTFYKTDELAAIVAAEPEQRGLVIVPVEHVANLQESGQLKVEVISDNTELAIAVVTASNS